MSEGSQPSAGELRADGAIHKTDIYGGAAMLLFAVAALVYSVYRLGMVDFFGPVFMPRVLALVIGLAGAGVAGGLLRVRNQQDFYGGVALVGLAVATTLAGVELPGMRGFAFGPGTAPRLFALLLAALGGLVAFNGLIFKGPALERFAIRGPVFLTASVFAFAATIRPLGLVIASYVTILIAAAATPDVKWRETVIWGAVLTAFCALLFPYGLNLPMQLWPRF